MTSENIKIKESWEKYQAQIKQWLSTGKYKEWQFADNIITDYETYMASYYNERNKLRIQAEATKKSYLKKENITRRLLNKAVVYKRTTVSKIAKSLNISFKETQNLFKGGNLIGTKVWEALLAATDKDYDEASYWYSTVIPNKYPKTKRGERKQITQEDVVKIVFGDAYVKQTT